MEGSLTKTEYLPQADAICPAAESGQEWVDIVESDNIMIIKSMQLYRHVKRHAAEYKYAQAANTITDDTITV